MELKDGSVSGTEAKLPFSRVESLNPTDWLVGLVYFLK